MVGLTTLGLATAATVGARPAGAPTGPAREPLAAIPDRVFTLLEQMNRKLADLIEDVEKDETRNFKAGTRYVETLKGELTRLLPPVFGVKFSELFSDLEAIDSRLDEAAAALPDGKKAAGLLERAKTRLGLLRGALRGSPERAAIPDEVFEELGRLERELRDLGKQLEEGKPEELTEKQAKARIDKIRNLKRRLLERFPTVYDLKFKSVFGALEDVDRYLARARAAFDEGETDDVVTRLRLAKAAKEHIERLFKAVGGKLSLRLTPSHTDDRVCVLVSTEPGATIDYTADGPSGYRSHGGFTLAADQSAVVAVSQIREPGEYVITVEGELESKPPVTRTRAYTVPDLASRGPFACPPLEPEPPPSQTVECSGTLTRFGAGRPAAREPEGVFLEMIAAMLCTKPGSEPRSQLGVSITRFDLQLPGSRQVTNWLAPPGFTCGPVTRTTTNDTLRCTGPFPLGQTVTANVRMSPSGTAGMGASLYVLADGVERGPFALTGP
jgi:hypothetical protein